MSTQEQNSSLPSRQTKDDGPRRRGSQYVKRYRDKKKRITTGEEPELEIRQYIPQQRRPPKNRVYPASNTLSTVPITTTSLPLPSSVPTSSSLQVDAVGSCNFQYPDDYLHPLPNQPKNLQSNIIEDTTTLNSLSQQFDNLQTNEDPNELLFSLPPDPLQTNDYNEYDNNDWLPGILDYVSDNISLNGEGENQQFPDEQDWHATYQASSLMPGQEYQPSLKSGNFDLIKDAMLISSEAIKDHNTTESDIYTQRSQISVVEDVQSVEELEKDEDMQTHEYMDGSDSINHNQQAAIQAIMNCLQSCCPCTSPTLTAPGKSLEEMSKLVSLSLEKSELLRAHEHAPLALSKPIGTYTNPPTFLNWKALLTGEGIDPLNVNMPPSLDFDLSQQHHLSNVTENVPSIRTEFDIDSVIFLATNLGVFRHDIDWSFRPNFVRSKQQDQHIYFPGFDMLHDKCLPICYEGGRWSGHLFFANMPQKYVNEHGVTKYSETQHLDDYALRIWTDCIFIPALLSVCEPGRLHHYPTSFDKVQSDGNIQNETNPEANSTRMDTIKLIPSHLLEDLWNKVLELAKNVDGTLLPVNAFADPFIVISSHNLKLAKFSKKATFSEVRTAFMDEVERRWNIQYIETKHFWLDLGHERIMPSDRGTTLLRKQACNLQWAEYLRDPNRKSPNSVEIVTYPWAGTRAGSASANTKPSNSLRKAGLGYCKVYNVVKEQHATHMKNHTAFQNPLLEALSYSEEAMKKWASKQNNRNGWPSRVDRKRLLQQLQNTKQRIIKSFRNTDHVNYGDRQEWRINMDLFQALPNDLEPHSHPVDSPKPENHQNFWILETKHVNSFRIAEANRWLVTLECVAASASSEPGTNKTVPLVEQELNSLMATAMVRILRLSLGCLNSQQYPDLWLGKRWVKSRFCNNFRHNNLVSTPIFQRRQGLELGQSVTTYGMMWLPKRLCIWNLRLPIFKTNRYPNLDINVNRIRAALKVSSAALRSANRESHVREYTRIKIAQVIESSSAHEQPFINLCDILAQMCVQAYNLAMWDEVITRWIAHCEDPQADASMFETLSNRSELSKSGLEVISFESLRRYLGSRGAKAVSMFDIAFCKAKTQSTHFPTWSDNSWKGRISPLFRPSSKQPNWARKKRYVLKYEEIIMLLSENLDLETDSSHNYIATFHTRLEIIAARHMQAIFHYEYDKAISVAKASSQNSQATRSSRRQESQLLRTKWMFPRFSDSDVTTYAIRSGCSHSETRISSKQAKAIADNWLVLTDADKQYLSHDSRSPPLGYPPKYMVRKGSFTGSPDKLEKLEAFLDKMDIWLVSESNRQRALEEDEDSGNETDWPPMPNASQPRRSSSEEDMP